MKCLDKDKANRYQSAIEVLTMLDNIEKGIPPAIKATPKKAITSKEITVTFSLKRLLLPALIMAFLVIIAIVIMQFLPGKKSASELRKPAIAVLSFDNFSPNPEDAYFADGMQEQLVSTLSKIRGVSVRGRTSVMRYRDHPKSLPEIAAELDVSYILEGSARMAGDQVSVTAILIDARNEEPLWSQEFDRKFSVEEILSIHREIAEQVASQLRAVLTPEEHAQIEVRPTESLEAYQAYLKGRFFWLKRTRQSIKEGMGHFQEAISIDSKYALAWAGLADSYIQLAGYGALPPGEAFPSAREAAKKALELNPTLGEAHLSLAWIDFNFEKGRKNIRPGFERAIELAPNLSNAYHWYCWYLAALGDFEEAKEMIQIALDLDPLVLIYNASYGYLLFASGDVDAAFVQFEAALALDQTFPRTHWMLGQALVISGKTDRALQHLSQAIAFSGNNPVYIATYAWACGIAGDLDKARQYVRDLEREAASGYVSYLDLAVAYLGLGEIDRAFNFLDESVRSNDLWLCYIALDPRFESVRKDPRLVAVLRALGY
jgi:TolB-like protein/Tfp pilus assembly protein PilF